MVKYSVESCRADVLEHADRGDRVELLAAEVAVVLQADLDAVGHSPASCDPLPGERGLRLADGDADRPGAVVARGVDRHRAPAAPDVEQPQRRALVQGRACGRSARAWPLAPRSSVGRRSAKRAHEYVIDGPSTRR